MFPCRLAACLALVVLAGAACGSGPGRSSAAAPELLPPETFDWIGEAISFSIPPAGWRREGETSGGVKGVRFVKERSVGEGIGLGDYYILADRNRGPYIEEMLDSFDSYDAGFAWDRALRKTYAHTDTPFTARESEIAAAVNRAVSQADTSFRNRERAAAKAYLEAALAESQKLEFSLDDVIDRVEFTPERQQEPDRYQLTGRREAVIAGEPAIIVDYTVAVPDRARTYAAREAYVLHNSHLFICTFIGLPETLAVFDAIIASIEFPGVMARRLAWPLLATFVVATGCGPRNHAGVERTFELGSHRVQVLAPAGWELADQGAQKRFRKGESQIVLVDLEPETRRIAESDLERLGDLDRFAEWGLAALGGAGSGQRREVRSRRTITTIDSHEAVDVETWNRLDHTWPQRLLFLRVDDDLFALHTPGRADADTMKAFDAILGSLHFTAPPA